jgi:hypothetical protein
MKVSPDMVVNTKNNAVKYQTERVKFKATKAAGPLHRVPCPYSIASISESCITARLQLVVFRPSQIMNWIDEWIYTPASRLLLSLGGLSGSERGWLVHSPPAI